MIISAESQDYEKYFLLVQNMPKRKMRLEKNDREATCRLGTRWRMYLARKEKKNQVTHVEYDSHLLAAQIAIINICGNIFYFPRSSLDRKRKLH